MIDFPIENKLIEKLKKRLILERIDTSLLKKEAVEIFYQLDDMNLGLVMDSKLPQFNLYYRNDPFFLGEHISYKKESFKNLDEQIDAFINCIVLYYKNPDKRLPSTLERIIYYVIFFPASYIFFAIIFLIFCPIGLIFQMINYIIEKVGKVVDKLKK